MTALWHQTENRWELLSPVGFPDEATLHDLVAKAPHLLPIAGSPDLIILGSEVSLGAGYADLLAVEPSGRLCIIEIKLARNAEARRAVVGQVLAYAALLHGLSLEQLEKNILSKHLTQNDCKSIAAVVETKDQSGAFEPTSFGPELTRCLADGSFRIVIVLDSVPPDLARTAAYLEAVAPNVMLDLIALSTYEAGASKVLVPQRIEPARHAVAGAEAPHRESRGQLSEGVDVFVESYQEASAEHKVIFEKLVEWARQLETDGLVKLFTFEGVAQRWTLLPRLQPENVGLVTIWNEKGPSIQFWRSVFERRAKHAIERVEVAAGMRLGQGNTTTDVSDRLLESLTAAYREAARAAE